MKNWEIEVTGTTFFFQCWIVCYSLVMIKVKDTVILGSAGTYKASLEDWKLLFFNASINDMLNRCCSFHGCPWLPFNRFACCAFRTLVILAVVLWLLAKVNLIGIDNPLKRKSVLGTLKFALFGHSNWYPQRIQMLRSCWLSTINFDSFALLLVYLSALTGELLQ